MKRRAFIAALGGAAAWPVVARAQQPAMPVIGYVSSRSAQADAHLVAAFRSGLREIGYLEGQNVGIEFRWADGDYTRHEGLVVGLVRQKVDVIVATSAPTAVVAKKVPRGAIPLVFTSGGRTLNNRRHDTVETRTLAELITETEQAISDADTIADRLWRCALNPVLSPDAVKAHKAAEFAQFAAKRLRNVLPLLEQRH